MNAATWILFSFPMFVSQRGVLISCAEGLWDAFPAPRAPFGVILCRLNLQIPQPDQVVGGSREGEDPSHVEDSTMPHFPQ
jgi:hypothetical protein